MTPPPLPATDAATVITERAKLPADILPLVDPATPLPVGVTFFERQFTLGGVLSAALWSGGLAVLGGLSLLFFVYDLVDSTRHATVATQVSWWPLGFAFTCGIAAWVMASAVFERRRLLAAQRAGESTRAGIFLTATTLIEATESSWTVIPRAAVLGVADAKVTYRLNDQDKSLTLPATLVNTDRSAVERAIAAWLTSHPPT